MSEGDDSFEVRSQEAWNKEVRKQQLIQVKKEFVEACLSLSNKLNNNNAPFPHVQD